MPLQITMNPRPAGNLSIAANQRARFSSVLSLPWNSVTGKPDFAGTYQPLDSDLTTIASISPSNDDILQRKAGAWTSRTPAQLITDLGALGTTFQPLDSDLTALAGNSTNGLWARTGTGTGSARTITGTANEITAANGDGVSGDPTLSLPSALTFTGKTITGGAYVSPTVTTGIEPTTDDGAALGSTSKKFSDGFFASGAVLNFNSGDYTVTHSTGLLSFSGGLRGYGQFSTFGIGGSSSLLTSFFVLDGSSAASQPVVFQINTNGSARWQWGLMTGSGGLDYAWYRNGSSLFAFRISISDDSVSFNSTTASTSSTTGAAKVAGGLGVAGAGYFGGLISSASSVKSTSATAGLGYATGAGGTVTQGTNKSTGVTLDKVCGQITMHNAALNAGTAVSFTLTNSAIASTDTVRVNIQSGATANSYNVDVTAVAAGSCRIQLRNFSGSNLSEALVLNFAVLKGVTS